MSGLVLSLFPGIDLLGMGFEAEGYSVVRGPDKLFGGDIRAFHVPAGRFDGVIGGPPCQEFSGLRRQAPTGEGLELLGEFLRVVCEAEAEWFLVENVTRVPTVSLPGYSVQRFNLNACECGGTQSRNRTFQFGSRSGAVLVPDRKPRTASLSHCCLASEGAKQERRGWPDFCELQGLPRGFDLPGYSVEARYRAVGNGVPVYMARVVAAAVKSSWATLAHVRLCACDCGRIVSGRRVTATAACRKRMQRRREKV